MRRKKLLPARSMLATRGNDRATATWALKHHVWFCESASKHLKWMVGMENFNVASDQLIERGFSWNWLPAPSRQSPKPPFMPTR